MPSWMLLSFHALEKEKAAHSSVLTWRIPGTGGPAGLPSVGSHRVGHDCSDLAAPASLSTSLPDGSCWPEDSRGCSALWGQGQASPWRPPGKAFQKWLGGAAVYVLWRISHATSARFATIICLFFFFPSLVVEAYRFTLWECSYMRWSNLA